MSENISKPLMGKVALVTGATRGVGKGIALQLGQAGATVYITGRTVKSQQGGLGSLQETCDEIKRRGGKCIPIKCDHEKDEEIASLFQQIARETNNRLDILVNNAFKGVDSIFTNSDMPFWEMKPEIWDDLNNVGLRNHYICTVYAARMMVPAKQGLIVNISSIGGMRYLFNVPYGVGKAAVDRMAADCGVELRPHNIACVSLYPGAVRTELIMDQMKSKDVKVRGTCGTEIKLSDFFGVRNSESPEFTGKVIVAMAQDPTIMSYTSKVVLVADYAQCRGIRDIDNKEVASMRQVSFYASLILPERAQFLTRFIPNFVKVPNFVLTAMNTKF
jgi:dehydrogenase/reductase SDR family protein 1